MASDGNGCGWLHALYEAARDGEVEEMRGVWSTVEPVRDGFSTEIVDQLEESVTDGDTDAVEQQVADLLYRERESPRLNGRVPTLLGALLYGFGYVAAFVLFLRAHSRGAVVNRLRWAYRTVGVDIHETETIDGLQRTTFRCPYRTVGAGRYGQRRVCHDVLDRVDDGYVTFLDRHRDLDYQRPRACAVSECCYSEVAER